MSYDRELFAGKNLSSLFEEIYNNSVKKRDDIDAIIAETTSMIESTEDVIQIAPLIKDYLEVSVKNNEHLIKLAGIAQRASGPSGAESLEDVLDFDNLQSLLEDSRKEVQPPSTGKKNEDTV